MFKKIPIKEGVSLSDFKKSLVHISVYEALKQNKPGNSRYVFLGMYAFRGYLAGLVSKYISGNGKQLQQYLGNVFSNERLSAIFDDLNLESCVSLHENLKIDTLKHIFAQAYLGFIYQYAHEAFIEHTAFKYFLKDSDRHLPKLIALNQIQILKAKADQVLGQKVRLLHSIEEIDGKKQFTTQILLNLEGKVAEHSSVSQTYAKKKAVKLALKFVFDKEAELPQVKDFLEKKKISQEEEKKREKAEKEKKHKQFIEKKRQKREVEKEKKRIEAKEKEYRRILNKKGAKNNENLPKKKEKIKIKAKDIENMSSAKRRRIQDKLK